jgi:hypothetical protein
MQATGVPLLAGRESPPRFSRESYLAGRTDDQRCFQRSLFLRRISDLRRSSPINSG